MNKEQAIQAIKQKIEDVKDREDRLQILGYIQAAFDFGFLDYLEVTYWKIEAMGIRV